MSDVLPENADRLSDDEIVYRRVPPEPPFHTPKDWLTTANFDLNSRQNELGLSVYCASVKSAQEVLMSPEAIPNSFIVSASVEEIRQLKNGKGEPLHLDVIVADDGGKNPGHAEIRGPIQGRLSRASRKALRDLFARRRIDF
jgi:hypothetical protein